MALQRLSTGVSSRADCSGHLPSSASDSRESSLARSQPAQAEACAYCANLHFPWLVSEVLLRCRMEAAFSLCHETILAKDTCSEAHSEWEVLQSLLRMCK